MAKAGRPPKLLGHPKADAILADLLTPGANLTHIQRKYEVTREALDTFRAKHIHPVVQEMLDRSGKGDPIEAIQRDVMARIARLIARGEDMLAAADAWLRDPVDPSRYNLNPRTHEVDVVFEETIDGDPPRTIRKTEKLSKLLRDVEDGLGITVVKGETKTADPRKLLLEAIATLKPVLELLGKATGQIKPDPGAVINIAVLTADPAWQKTQAAIVDAIRPFPGALEAVLAVLPGEEG